jgi:hypothetical protein
MSDETARVPEPEWPTHCEHCGTRLASAEVGVMPGGDEQLDTVVARDFCPNPDCPSRSTSTAGTTDASGEVAGAAGGSRGATPAGAPENRPGSLGGDNGGA